MSNVIHVAYCVWCNDFNRRYFDEDGDQTCTECLKLSSEVTRVFTHASKSQAMLRLVHGGKIQRCKS